MVATPTGPCDRWQVSACRHMRSPSSEGVADTRPGSPRAQWAAAQRRHSHGQGRPVEGRATSHPPGRKPPSVVVVQEDTLPPVCSGSLSVKAAANTLRGRGRSRTAHGIPMIPGSFKLTRWSGARSRRNLATIFVPWRATRRWHAISLRTTGRYPGTPQRSAGDA